MKGWIWLFALALIAAAFPISMSLSSKAVRKGNAAGVTMMVGMAFMTVYDPKAAAAVELIQRRKEIGDPTGEAADQPKSTVA